MSIHLWIVVQEQHCINMVKNWQIDLTDNQYKDKIEKMLKDKLIELQEVL